MSTLYCQSCGMPMTEPQEFGSERNGEKSKDYCVYCYEQGEFKQPNITLPEMIQICIPHMTETGMDEQQARNILNNTLPKYKRWASVQG